MGRESQGQGTGLEVEDENLASFGGHPHFAAVRTLWNKLCKYAKSRE